MTKPTRGTHRARGERGIATILTSLVLIPLMVFAAFGVDIASWYVRIGDLQRAADAAALAGAVWMPNLGRATAEATDSLRSNGFIDGQDGIDVTIERGATPTSLRVEVTDTDADRYFSAVFNVGPQSLDRSAEAEYNLPLPLGSPLNYFGGDSTHTVIADVVTYTVVWPIDYTTTPPLTRNCNVGVTPQQLGRWPTSGNFQPSAANSGSVQCRWATTPTSRPSDYASNSHPPTNRPCNVPTGVGRWPTSGNFEVGLTFTSGTGNRPCEFTAMITSSTTSTPNPIDSTRSPGFWAAVEGPRTRAYQGDAFSTRCWATSSCSGVQNAMYATDADRGFWYVVKIPPGLGGTVALNVFDAAYNPIDTNTLAGDRLLDSDSAIFPTQFQVYQQTNPLDFSARTASFSGAADTTPGSCNWSISNDASFRGRWQNLCNLSVAPNETYLINVQTTGSTGSGVNGYSLEAVANGSQAGVQPALYAFAAMAMQNNNNCSPTPCAPPPATFYLAEVGPQYAGRILVMELWDPGDVSAGVTASMKPMRPSPTDPRPVVQVPAADCSWTADSIPNSPISGTTGSVVSAPQPSDDSTNCLIRTSTSGTSRFNGEWLRIRIDVPATYTCTVGLNPETTAGSCWWGIQYTFTGSANDVTTWQARIEGNPLQLTQ